MLVYDFECVDHGCVEAMVDSRDEIVPCPECQAPMDRLMSCPAIHTLETLFRGYKNEASDDRFVSAHGEFVDHNLIDKKTGEPCKYSSPRERQRLLKENGLYELPASTKPKRRKERPMVFTKEGARTSKV